MVIVLNDGIVEYKFIIRQLSDSGLTFNMIASGLNITPESARKIDGRFQFKGLRKYDPRNRIVQTEQKRGRHSKIDRDKYISLWKNGVPYENIAKYFGVSLSYATHYKSTDCKGITRNTLCPKCGTVFVTDRYNRSVCDSCRYESQVGYWQHKQWAEKLEEGTRLIEKRRKAKLEEEMRKDKKREERKAGREWWWE